jgi:hypothetical protein
VRLANEVDHIVPRSRGGTGEEDNLQAINSECQKLKTIGENGGRARIRIGLDGFPLESSEAGGSLVNGNEAVLTGCAHVFSYAVTILIEVT